MGKVGLYFKRSPMHLPEKVGDAPPGITLRKVFSELDNTIIDAIDKYANVFVSSSFRDTVVVKSSKWKKTVLREGDRVTIVAVPGIDLLGWIFIGIFVSVAVSVILRPNIPKPDYDDSGGGTLYSFGGESNFPKAYTPIPAVFGKTEATLKYIAPPAGEVRVLDTRRTVWRTRVETYRVPPQSEGGGGRDGDSWWGGR